MTKRWFAPLFFRRASWTRRLVGLPPPARHDPAQPGLIMVQVDGLARPQLEHALARGRMPFLRSLIDREGYRLHTMYAGVPSTTPAVQAELFYGVAGAVPAFAFRHRASGGIFRMYEPASAKKIEQGLEGRGIPLLEGGSAYFNVYHGGAAEAHLCAAAFGWGDILRGVNPIALAALVLLNIWSFLRIAALLFVELGLALYDFARAMYSGRSFLKELKFIPTRVAICILARELLTIGVKLDITRGLPVVHVNFIGYDEQAHRRGPSSAFAHWTLKGIDDAIGRIYRAARDTPIRDYSLWVYSDHGQEEVQSYHAFHGRSVATAVAAVFANIQSAGPLPPDTDPLGVETQRVRQLGGRRFQNLLPVHDDRPGPTPATVLVTAMGPVGMVYLPDDLAAEVRDRAAAALVQDASIPMVLHREADGTAVARTARGRFQLPRDRQQVFGPDHPFVDEVAADLTTLCHHPDAGDLVICGWRHDAKPVSFPVENGAHGGPGPAETMAFAMAPEGEIPPPEAATHLRAQHLRQSALRKLKRPRGN